MRSRAAMLARHALPHPLPDADRKLLLRLAQGNPGRLLRLGHLLGEERLWHHGRCAVPGCRNTAYLDLHHLRPQADGGGSDEDDLVLICACHHRSVHRGFLIIEGRPSTGLAFFHADGTPYGAHVSPRAVEAHATAYVALTKLGFRESDVRQALDRLRSELGPDAPFQKLLRAALVLLSG